MKPPSSKTAIGLSTRAAGKHYTAARVDFSDIPGRIANSGMPNAEPGEIAKIMAGVQRPGSDHSRIKSRGVGC